jgi:hypothetical protein
MTTSKAVLGTPIAERLFISVKERPQKTELSFVVFAGNRLNKKYTRRILNENIFRFQKKIVPKLPA